MQAISWSRQPMHTTSTDTSATLHALNHSVIIAESISYKRHQFSLHFGQRVWQDRKPHGSCRHMHPPANQQMPPQLLHDQLNISQLPRQLHYHTDVCTGLRLLKTWLLCVLWQLRIFYLSLYLTSVYSMVALQ